MRKVVLFDELAFDSRKVMREICAFLDIDAAREVDVTTKHNTASGPRSFLANVLLLKTVRLAHEYLPPTTLHAGSPRVSSDP